MTASRVYKSFYSTRHILVAFCFLAVVVGYTDRVNIAVAAVAMREQFHWSQTTKGLVLSSFFVGYISLMAFSGWLATKFGGLRVLAFAIFTWSLFTLLTPIAADHSLPALLIVRIGMGAGEAAMFPACYEIIGRCLPASERSRAVTRILSGIAVGTIAGLTASGWLVTHVGWSSSFYVFGALGLLWCAAWFWWDRATPQADGNASTSADPRDRASVGIEPRTVPWRALLSERAIWALFCGHFSANWLLFFFLSWLPSYFRDGLGLTIANAGLSSAAPWLAMIVATNLAGAIADVLAQRGVNLTLIRKVMQSIGLFVPALCLFLLRDVQSAQTAVALVCVAVAALGCSWAGYASNAVDIAPRYSGAIMGVSNTIATIPGIVGVSLSGWLYDVTGTFSAAFLLTAAISVVGGVIYLGFASARELFQ